MWKKDLQLYDARNHLNIAKKTSALTQKKHAHLSLELAKSIAISAKKNQTFKEKKQLKLRSNRSSPAMSVKRRSAWGGYSLSSSISR